MPSSRTSSSFSRNPVGQQISNKNTPDLWGTPSKIRSVYFGYTKTTGSGSSPSLLFTCTYFSSMVILHIVITKQPFYNNIDTLHVYSETTSMLNVKNMRLLYIQHLSTFCGIKVLFISLFCQRRRKSPYPFKPQYFFQKICTSDVLTIPPKRRGAFCRTSQTVLCCLCIVFSAEK